MREYYLLLLSMIVVFSGCSNPVGHHESLPSVREQKITLGTVQKEIRHGMSQATVAEVLGSPNIVSSDGPGQETWIYDRVSTNTTFSTSSGGVRLLILGWGTDVAGGVAPGYSASSGAATSTQRSLTVLVKFKEGKVHDFSYHASRF